MTGLQQLLADALAGEPRDDLDLVAVVAEGRRRRQRRRRWVLAAVAAGTATAVIAATVGPRLIDKPREPDPAPPTPTVVSVDVLPLNGAAELPGGALRTHHAPGDNLEDLSWDRWAGVTDDGYVVRIRSDFETDTLSIGLVDPATGSTEWLPQADYPLIHPDPLRLTTEELVFLDGAVNGSPAVAVYDRVAGRWSSYARVNAVNHNSQRMYPLDGLARAWVDAEDRLWIKLFEGPGADRTECSTPDDEEVDLTCWERWWSVPFREGGRATRSEAFEGTSLAWAGEVVVSASAEGLTIITPTGKVAAPLAAPEGCELRAGYPPEVYAASPPVVWIPCADGSGSVVIHDATGAPLFALPRDRYAGGGVAGDGFVGIATAGRDAELFLIEPQSRRVYTVASGPHTVFTDIGGGLVSWQSPEEGWSERDGSDYWFAELP